MKHKNLFIILVIFLFSFLLIAQEGVAQPTLVLEAEQHWSTYRVGGTCCFGSNNLFVADVDGDGTTEIVTGGYMYEEANSTVRSEAPLKIWSWNGENVTLEKSKQWAGIISAIHAADADNDGTVEIVTVGCMYIDNLCDPDMRIWSIAAPLPIELIIVPVVSVAVVVLAGTYLLIKRFRK